MNRNLPKCAPFALLCLGLCLVQPRQTYAQATSEQPAKDPDVVPYEATFFAPFRPVTALNMIGRIPGFQYDGGSYARGFAGTVGNVLIDGERPPARTDSLSTVLSRIPASQVMRIDIIRNGAGGVDMAGKDVVANVVRVPDTGVSGAAGVNLTLVGNGQVQPSFNYQVQRQRNGQSLEGSLRYSSGSEDSDSTRERRDPFGELLFASLQDGAFDFSSGEATGVYEGSLGGGRIRANVLASYNGSQYSGTDWLFPGGVEESATDTTRWRGEGGLRWTRSLPRGTNLQVVGFQSIIKDNSDGSYNTPFFRSRSKREQEAGESIVSLALKFAPFEAAAGNVNLETGAELAFNWVDAATAYTLDEDPLFIPGDDTRVEELRSEAFITAQWQARPNFNVEGNLRFEYSRISATGNAGEGENSLEYLKPRLVATWKVSPRHTAIFRAERTVEQLSFGAFTAYAAFSTGIFGRGNPDIRPAQIWSYSARYERMFGTQGFFSLEYLHEDLTDVLGAVIVHETPPGEATPRPFNVVRNVGEATRDTAALSLRQPLDQFGLAGGILSGQLSYAWSRTRDPVTKVDRELSGPQGLSWSVNLSQNLIAERINLNLNVSGSSENREYAPSTVSTFRSSPTVNFGLTYQHSDSITVSSGLFIGSGRRSAFTLFNNSRDVGIPLYDELVDIPTVTRAYMDIRRSF